MIDDTSTSGTRMITQA